MSELNTDHIWLALGDFFDLFPVEERVWWSTFWGAHADIVADLWGYAFQVDRSKSLFSTSATMERREVLVKLSGLTEGVDARFQISSLKQDGGDRWILRGFVPRDRRTFKSSDLPTTGLIRIGVDLIPYTSVNADTIESGVYTGFVREASFVLGSAPPHDYGDNPDFNDDFTQSPLTMAMRVNHVAGQTLVDAVGDGEVNPSGILILGTPGFNSEIVEYESVTTVNGRYVFQLATSWQSPDTGPEALAFSHAAGETLVVHRHDTDRWLQRLSGHTRITSRGDLRMVVDQEPAPAAAKAEALGQYQLQDNVDFDVSVAASIDTWPDPTPNSTSRRALARLNVGTKKIVIGIETRRTSAGVVEHVTVAGVEGAEIEEALYLTTPYLFEARFVRIGNQIELQYREPNDDFRVLTRVQASGDRATLDLVVDDPNTQMPSVVHFDEVVRRAGNVVGNVRLEDFFSATDKFPYTYDIDQAVTQATELRDRPRTRTEFLTTSVEIDTNDPGVIRAIPEPGVDFQAQGVPEAGVIQIQGTKVLYDQVTRDGSLFVFRIRGRLDPNIIPVPVNTAFTVSTRVLFEGDDYELTGDGKIRLKELPTRDRMWAPVARVDVKHVQNLYGRLVDLDAEVSTDAYLNRVQGTWYALMTGPSISNVHSGLQLAMALPVARTAGTVVAIDDVFDALGRMVKRTLTIQGEEGSFEHDLNPSLYPFIDWSVVLGQAVEEFQPLSNGVEVVDFIKDSAWHLRFPGVSGIERFNAFGVFVALESLSADASVEDALRFALRIKPTYTKMFMRFLLTSGNEDMSEDLDDDMFAAHVPQVFDDISFDEGQAPEDPLQILRLGDGHKLGQGKKLGGTGLWQPERLGTYTRQGPFTADGQVTAGSSVFTGAGGYSFVDFDSAASGSVTAGSDVFTHSSAYVFTAADVGKDIVILDSLEEADNGSFEVLEVISGTQARVAHVFVSGAPALDWRLRASGFTDADVGKNIHVVSGPDAGDHKILSITSRNEVEVAYTFTATNEALDWELRSYRQLGSDETLGEIRAYKTPIEGEHMPEESLDSEQIVTVSALP